jgi:hypothetical protein
VGGPGAEMTQALYAHMNKKKRIYNIKKKEITFDINLISNI